MTPQRQLSPTFSSKNLFGFKNESVAQLDIKMTCTHIVVLKKMMELCYIQGMDRMVFNGKAYTWISGSMLLEKFLGFHMTKDILYATIRQLISYGLLERKTVQHSIKKQSYYHITSLTKEITTLQ